MRENAPLLPGGGGWALLELTDALSMFGGNYSVKKKLVDSCIFQLVTQPYSEKEIPSSPNRNWNLRPSDY